MKYFFIIIFLLFFCVFNAPFPWSKQTSGGSGISTVTSVPSNRSSCPGGIDLIVDGNVFPCIGGAGSYPTTNNCINGLTGIMLNNTLVCGVIGKLVPAGNNTGDCLYGGIEFLSNTINTTLCYDNPLTQQEIDQLYSISNFTSSEIAMIAVQLNDVAADVASLFNQILILNNDLVLLTANVTSNYNQIQIIQSTIISIQNNISILIATQNNLISRLDDLTINVSMNTYNIEALKINVTLNLNDIFARLANDSSYLNYLYGQLGMLQSTLAVLSYNESANYEAIQNINYNISQINSQLSIITSDISSIQSHLTMLDSQYNDLSGNLTVAQSSIIVLQYNISVMQNTITSILFDINHINDRFTNSSSFTFNIGPNNTISGSVFVGVESATSGGYDLWNSAHGAIISLKQLFGISNFLDFTSTPTGLQLVSFLSATNIPYTTYNPALFPDCAGSTLTSELISCLAGRTLSSITNVTQAADVMYTPTVVFQNMTQFSVAFGFDIIFGKSAPTFTRLVHVDCQNGDDIWKGGPFDPYKSLISAMNSIGSNPFNQATQIIINSGFCNEVGDLLFKPNTFIVGSGLRVVNFNLTGNVYLSSNWATFAGSHVEAGITGIFFKATMMMLNFTDMGAAGVNSFAKFSFSQSEMATPIDASGRGSMDFVHANEMDFDYSLNLNCVNSHIESCSGIVGNVLVTDVGCSSSLLTEHLIFNYFEESNYTIIQSTSNIVLDSFLNGWDQGYFILRGNLTVNTYTLPSHIIKDNTVNLIFNLNFAGSIMCNLSSYFSAPCLDADQIVNEMSERAHALKNSGTGISLLYFSNDTTDILNDLNTDSPVIPISSYNGSIHFGFNDPTTNFTGGNNRSCLSHSGQVVCDIDIVVNAPDDLCKTGSNSIISSTISINLCSPIPFNTTMLNMSFTSGNAYLNITNTNNLNWLFTDVTNRTTNSQPFLTITSNPSTGLVLFDFTPPNIVGDSFMNVTQNGTTYSFAWNGQILSNNQNLMTISFNRSLGTYTLNPIDLTTNFTGSNNRNCISHQGQTVCDNFILLNSTSINRCPLGFVTITSIQGSFISCIPYDSITSLLAGNNIVLIPGIGVGNYTISVVASPSLTSLTLSNPLPISSGGTATSTATPNGFYIANSAGNAASTQTLNTGQVFVGTTGLPPVPTTPTGTSQQVSVSPSLVFGIPSTFKAPGTIQDTSGFLLSMTSTISAAGATQGTATIIITSGNIVTTVALNTGVRLPIPPAAGELVTITNRGANPLNIYPASGGTINDAGTDNPVILYPGESVIFEASSTTQWYSLTPLNRRVGRLYTANGANVVITNSAALTTIISPTGDGSLRIKGNSFRNASEIQIYASGILSAKNSDTGRIDVLLGSTVITTFPATDMGPALLNVGFTIRVILVIRSIGATGTAIGEVQFTSASGGTTLSSITTSAVVIDTTVDQVLDVQFKFGIASLTTTLTTVVFTSTIIY